MTGSFLKDLMHRVGSLALNQADVPADGDLLARFVRDRDESAFAGLLTRHAPLVWGVCRGLLAHDADAEDAFQATFLALVRGAKNVRTTHTLAPWLHATATRVAKKARLSKARRAARDRTAARSEVNGAAVPDSAWDVTFLAVHEEIARLPEAMRSAFVLCVLEGDRYADAASKLGVPIGTLSARVSRARQRLMEKLTARGLAPTVAAAALALGGSAGPAAVPTSLMNTTCSTLLAGAKAVPASILTLAQVATEGSVMKVKLLAAGVMIAAGLALSVSGGGARLGVAEAQSPPPANVFMPPPADPRGMPAGYLPHTTTQWEYKIVNRPHEPNELEKLLTDLGKQGWEYAGSELYPRPPLSIDKDKVVFKRHANGTATSFTPVYPSTSPLDGRSNLVTTPENLPKPNSTVASIKLEALTEFAAQKFLDDYTKMIQKEKWAGSDVSVKGKEVLIHCLAKDSTSVIQYLVGKFETVKSLQVQTYPLDSEDIYRVQTYPLPSGVSGADASKKVAEIAKVLGMEIKTDLAKDGYIGLILVKANPADFEAIKAIFPEAFQKLAGKTK